MAEVSDELKVQNAEKEIIEDVLREHLNEGHAIGLWRVPGTTKKNLIVSTEGVQWLDDLTIEDLGTGFAFAPFDADKKKIFLKANVSYSIENGELVPIVFNVPYDIENNAKKLGAVPFYPTKSYEGADAAQNDFTAIVEKAIEQIEAGNFEKLVPSRCKQIELPNGFDLVDTFNTLCAKYPNAFVSLVSAREIGTWLGASPELLVSVDDQMAFKTVAVAGTQVLPPQSNIKHVAWTQKEIEEQALVSRYIVNCFKKIRLREYIELGPKTWKAGNLAHLKTEFEVDMNATNFPQLGSVMLKLLHPTSAVCGMPREESIAFLKSNESFDRSFYSGYLGPINFENKTSLFVNLRCMQWCGDKAILYAGAGVTIDSIPEKEWEETEMKMNTLLQVIQS
ncbi:MAG: chorismate-binding protein [Cyclobacteriaceae bacterium]